MGTTEAKMEKNLQSKYLTKRRKTYALLLSLWGLFITTMQSVANLRDDDELLRLFIVCIQLVPCKPWSAWWRIAGPNTPHQNIPPHILPISPSFQSTS
jgi:hypothetical protein